MLGLCSLSGNEVWIRLDCSPSGDGNALNDDAVGHHFLITSLQYISKYADGTTCLKGTRSTRFRRVEEPRHAPPTEKSLSLSPFRWRDTTSYPIRDALVQCDIVGWRVDSDVLEVHGVSSNRMTIVFQYYMPSRSTRVGAMYAWLRAGGNISIKFCSIREYDGKYDILRIVRSEHTIVSTRTSRDSGFSQSTAALQGTEILLENEKHRYEALCIGKGYYEKRLVRNDCDVQVRESCLRRRIANVRLQEMPYQSSTYDGHIPFRVGDAFVGLISPELMLLVSEILQDSPEQLFDILLAPQKTEHSDIFSVVWLARSSDY